MKVSKKLLSVMLAFALLLTAAAVGSFNVSADGDETFSTGDTLFYGTYPQSRVTDESLIEALNAEIIEIEWTDYGYYTGYGENDGRMAPAQLMSYQDIVISNVKYRGVKIDSYRPDYTSGSSSASNTQQDYYGYTKGNVYWFAFEPIQWKVLDPDFGLVVSTSALDSQAYNDFIVKSENKFWGNTDKTFYANNYVGSSIREWLNNDFMMTAFSEEQQANIKVSTLNNDCPENMSFSAAATQDKVFLLSYYDVNNSDFGFTSDESRVIPSTDYAKCQGAYEFENSTLWWLRTPDSSSIDAYFVSVPGVAEYSTDVNETDMGIRPAMALTNLVSDPTGAPLYGGIGIVGDDSSGIPKLRINAETNFWEVSYDDGETWESLDVKATGENGADGADGKDGKDGVSVVSMKFNDNGELVITLSDGSEINAGKPSGSASDTDAQKPAIAISGYQASRSVDYGTTITFHATADFIPEGYAIHWYVNGEDKGTSETLTVSNASGSFTVCARLMKEGSTISESAVEKVNVKADFISRIIAFFKKLINKNAFIIDQI